MQSESDTTRNRCTTSYCKDIVSIVECWYRTLPGCTRVPSAVKKTFIIVLQGLDPPYRMNREDLKGTGLHACSVSTFAFGTFIINT